MSCRPMQKSSTREGAAFFMMLIEKPMAKPKSGPVLFFHLT